MKHYSRKLLVLAFALAVVATAYAKPRTQSQMQQAARQALSYGGLRLNMPSTAPLKTLAQTTSYAVYGFEEGGFAVVSSDDLVPELLGVSSKSYSPENKNFQWWLNAVNEAVSYAVAHNRRLATTKPSELGYEPVVGPLLTTEWDQETPYNNYCPGGSNSRCLTGCVATAMAQVLNYHQTPVHGIGTRTIYYPFQNANGEAVTANFEDHFYDWDNMLDKYVEGNYTSAQAHAVAELMRDCGVAANMQYGTSLEGGSGAYSGDAAEGLRKYFGIETAECKYRDSYSEVDWMAMVYSELSTNGPLYYGGSDPTPFFGGGHAFVLHGYREDGMVYVNWGWSGDDDGYYDISLLNPPGMKFSVGQDMIVGVCGIPRDLMEKEVALAEAGTLAEQIPEEELGSIGTLKVTGQVNSDDLRLIRRLAGCDENGAKTKCYLSELDLSEAEFVEGGSAYFIEDEGRTKLTIKGSGLPERAFYGCRQLISVKLPASISTYGEGAFALCHNLKAVELTPSADADFVLEDTIVWNKQKNEVIALLPYSKGTLRLPEGTTALRDYALAGCSRLTEVTLPKGLETIGREAFNGCSGLSELRIMGREVPQLTGSDVFKTIGYGSCKLYVKRDMKQVFARSAQWSAFSDNGRIIEFGTAVKAINKVREYGNSNPVFTYQMLGDKIAGMPYLSCSAEPSSDAGRYTITIEKGTLDADESVDFIDGYLVVKKAELTVSIANASRGVGESDPEFTMTFQGFKLDDDESVIEEMPTVQTTATAGSPVGTYEYILTGGKATNYDFVYDGKGVFTITGTTPTAIGGIFADGEAVDVYTLNGILLRRVSRLSELPNGIYVVKGRKVVVSH